MTVNRRNRFFYLNYVDKQLMDRDILACWTVMYEAARSNPPERRSGSCQNWNRTDIVALNTMKSTHGQTDLGTKKQLEKYVNFIDNDRVVDNLATEI